MPVDDLLPKTNAISVTLSMSTPRSPAFPNPVMNDAIRINSHCDSV
jgi:hypothetical protein